MKNLLVRSFMVGISLVFLSACQSKHHLEDTIWNCISDQFTANNHNLDNEFSKYETFLITEGYLSEATGAGYLSIYRDMEETNDVRPIPINHDFIEIINRVMENSSETCVTEEELSQTKLYQLKLKAEETIDNSNNLTISLIGEVMQDVYSEKDLEHPFHRFTVLMNMTQFTKRDAGIARQLPSIDLVEQPNIEGRNLVEIDLNEKNEATLNNKPLVLENLKEQLLPYIRGSSSDDTLPEQESIEIAPHGAVAVSKAVILTRSDRATSYASYIAVQNEIVAAYNQVRNEVSQKYYQKNYEALSEDERSLVHQMVPFRLTEAE